MRALMRAGQLAQGHRHGTLAIAIFGGRDEAGFIDGLVGFARLEDTLHKRMND